MDIPRYSQLTDSELTARITELETASQERSDDGSGFPTASAVLASRELTKLKVERAVRENVKEAAKPKPQPALSPGQKTDAQLDQEIKTLQDQGRQFESTDVGGIKLNLETRESINRQVAIGKLQQEQKRRIAEEKKRATEAAWDALTEKREKEQARFRKMRKMFGGGKL